jgi:hypothetical protein
MFLSSPSQVRGIAADELFERDALVVPAPPLLNLEYGSRHAGTDSDGEGAGLAGAGSGAGECH